METQGNKLSFKTYKSAKVNESNILIPELQGIGFNLESDKERLDDFAGDEYGISKDIVDFNIDKNNLYKSYTSNEDSTILDIVLTDENPELIDVHDIVCKENEEIEVVLNYETTGSKDKFRSSMVRIHAMENSKVTVYLISMDGKETTSYESIYAKLEENSNINLYEYRLGASKVVSNTKADVKGDFSNLNIDSIYFGYGNDDLDIDYDLIHYGKESKSDLMVNGALKDNATKLFKSTLDFKQGSKKSNGSEEEYVILLSDDVHSQSVPVLLSGEDDIAGNHAASAGKLDMDIIFYLMSRGLTREEAESLVINTRFASAIDSLKDEKHKEAIWNKVHEIMG